MENQKINQIVKSTKAKFKASIIKYLIWQVSNCTAALTKDERGNYTKHTVHILKLLLATRISALHHLERQPESKYDHNDWAQCMNITNIFYLLAKQGTYVSQDFNVKIAKAHFNYCCRYYIRTAPDGKQDECLQTIHDLNKWNQTPNAELKLAEMIMKKRHK